MLGTLKHTRARAHAHADRGGPDSHSARPYLPPKALTKAK